MSETRVVRFIQAFKPRTIPPTTRLRQSIEELEGEIQILEKWTKHLEANGAPQGPTSRQDINGLTARVAAAKVILTDQNEHDMQAEVVRLQGVNKGAHTKRLDGRKAAKQSPFILDPTNTGRPAKVYRTDIVGFERMGDAPDVRFGQLSEQDFYPSRPDILAYLAIYEVLDGPAGRVRRADDVHLRRGA